MDTLSLLSLVFMRFRAYIVAFFVALPMPPPKKSRYRQGYGELSGGDIYDPKRGRWAVPISPSDFFSKTIRPLNTLQASPV